MGIVQSNSLKTSFVNYLGIIIGGLSTMFIYPLDWDLYGNIQFILSSSMLISVFFSLGSHALVNKYFPYFENQKNKGFLGLVLFYSLINIIIASIFIYFFYPYFTNLLEWGGFNEEQVAENFYFIYSLGILMVFTYIIRSQCYNFGQIAYPDVISNVSVKITVPIIVLLSYFSIINYQEVGWLLVIYHLVIVIWLMFFLKQIGGLDIHKGVVKRVKLSKHLEMIRYMLYGAMNHIGDILVYKIDVIMIGLMMTATDVGYYSIFLFLTVVIDIPTNAVIRTTKILISKGFENNELKEIERIYKSASVNLFSIGIILFVLIWLNMNTFFYIMTNGEDLMLYKTAFLFLALAKLFDMITSVNFHIISFSPYFRINSLFILILACINTLLNYYFIDNFGIVGAAISTAISMFLFNLAKTIFIIIKYKMQPFKWEYLIMGLFLVISILLPFIFPTLMASPIISGIISGVIVLLFIFSIYKLEVSVEINNFINKYWGKFFS